MGLRVRAFDPAETAVLASWFPDAAAVVLWGGPTLRFPLDAAQVAAMLAQAGAVPPERSLWTVVAEDGAVAGHFQLAYERAHRAARLGRVAIAPGMRGRGLAAVMVGMAADLAFESDTALNRLELRVRDVNWAARAAYVRAGFTLEGMAREARLVEGVFWNLGTMALLRREWEALRRVARSEVS